MRWLTRSKIPNGKKGTSTSTLLCCLAQNLFSEDTLYHSECARHGMGAHFSFLRLLGSGPLITSILPWVLNTGSSL